MPLPQVIEKVVLHWGEMGARWGVNRSVAQIHALLWLTGRPMNAEEIAETLGIARSNASTSLEELQTYRLVTLIHTIGDRRNYYEAKGDTWDVVQTIVDERKKREIDPTLEVLRAARDLAETDPTTPPDVKQRVTEMLGFMERMTGWYEQMRRVPKPTLQRLIKMGTGVARLIASR
ncbi:MAG: MarR family transcriptional regulator [Alphaproteobacteria bacterium]|nr:MarR family transcriptional regulator [Alphaproteobacteria bacterium]